MRHRRAGIFSSHRPGVHSITQLVQFTGLLGQVAGYTTGEGHHEIQALVDRVSWEAAWDAIRTTLARQGLRGAATVRLHIANEQPDGKAQETLWPPP